jgi:phage terminase large subunit
MAEITLKLKKSLFSPTLFPMLFDYSNRFEFYKGSAGSGKSYFITQKLIVRACREPIKILVCRRYGTTIRNTCFALFKEILTKWKLYPTYAKIRETDFNIKFSNGSEIIFTGLDEETKLLSLNNISCIFIEEVFETSKDILEQLSLRMRGMAEGQQIIAAFNPISKNHWLYDFCVLNPPSSFYFSETTYKDNPFLSSEYVNELEEMITRNPAKARIYVFGEWGVPLDGLVLRNWRTEDFDEMELAAKGFEHRAGMDIGYVDASAVLDTLYDKQNKVIYVFNEFYRSGCQLSELAAAIKDMNLSKTKLYVDSAEPRSIQFFRNEGINAVGATKGKDSVKSGYMFLQDNTIVIHPRCKNLIRDCENLSYRKSKQTGEYTEEFDNHQYTHTTDSLRYAYSDIYTNKKLKTMSKAALSL